jgi:hypothetical protein
MDRRYVSPLSKAARSCDRSPRLDVVQFSSSRVLPVSPIEEADDNERELITSGLTLLEELVVPLRAGNRMLAERYEALITRRRTSTGRPRRRWSPSRRARACQIEFRP